MAISAEDKNFLVSLYVGYFNRAPDPAGLQFWIDQVEAGRDTNTIAADFAASPEAKSLYPFLTTPDVSSPTSFITAVYANLFNRAPDAAGQAFWEAQLSSGAVSPADAIDAIIKGATTAPDSTILANKNIVGLDFATDAGNTPGFTFDLNGASGNAAKNAISGVTEDSATVTAAQAATDAYLSGASNPGQVFTLTTGIDNLVGTSANDTFNATQNATGPTDTLSSLDSIDGGAGKDTLNVVETSAIDTTALAGVSIKNVEVANLTSTSTVTANSSAWTGLTALNVVSADDVALTAGAETDVTVAASALSGASTVNGGKDVSITAADTATTAAASANSITVGGTTAPAGAIKVDYTETVSDAADAGIAGGTITTNGGTSVDVNSKATVGAGSNAADVFTVGAVTVNGGANTTSVSVTQSAATPTYDGGTNKNVKISNGAVDINDLNTATKADTIATATLNHFGNSTFTGNVLSTLNLTGGSSAALASGSLTIDQSAGLTTDVPTALTINMVGGHVGAITDTDDQYKTLNVASAADATIADLDFTNVTTMAVSGEGVTTVSALTDLAKATSITSTGGGLTITPELGTGVAVTGGAGVETVSIGATTKAVDLGAGDDVATLSVTALGAGGSLKGGEGTDTLVMNTNGSAIAGLPQIMGFETLRVAGAAAEGTHNANGFTALEVGSLNGATTFTNVAAGVGLTVLEAPGAATTVTLADATGTSDVFNLTLKSAATMNANTIDLSGVETVNIVSDDTETGATATANVNVLDLDATAAKSIVVTGDAGLNLTNVGNVAVTSFDASGVTGKDSDVTFVSANTTVGAVVNIKGGAGDDSLTGSATANDTIEGGAGADTLVYTGGTDFFTGGAGNDTFDVNATGTKAMYLTVSDAMAGDKIDLASIMGAGVGNVDYAAGAGGFGAQKVTLGAAATFEQYLNAAAADNGAGTGDEIVKWFNFESNTYLVVDDSDNTTFTENTDTLVKVAGVVDLTSSAMVDGVLTIA